MSSSPDRPHDEHGDEVYEQRDGPAFGTGHRGRVRVSIWITVFAAVAVLVPLVIWLVASSVSDDDAGFVLLAAALRPVADGARPWRRPRT